MHTVAQNCPSSFRQLHACFSCKCRQPLMLVLIGWVAIVCCCSISQLDDVHDHFKTIQRLVWWVATSSFPVRQRLSSQLQQQDVHSICLLHATLVSSARVWWCMRVRLESLLSRLDQWHCGLKKGKVGEGQEVAIFRQTAANFRQRRLWVLSVSILPLNFPKVGVFSPNFVFFGQKCLYNKNIFHQLSDSPKCRSWMLPPEPLPPPTTMPLTWTQTQSWTKWTWLHRWSVVVWTTAVQLTVKYHTLLCGILSLFRGSVHSAVVQML